MTLLKEFGAAGQDPKYQIHGSSLVHGLSAMISNLYNKDHRGYAYRSLQQQVHGRVASLKSLRCSVELMRLWPLRADLDLDRRFSTRVECLNQWIPAPSLSDQIVGELEGRS